MIGLDTETHLIRRGVLAPPVVCLGLAGDAAPPAWLPPDGPWFQRRPVPVAARASGVVWAGLAAGPLVGPLAARALAGPVAVSNGSYDLAVLATHTQDVTFRLAFDAVKAGRVHDTHVVDRLEAVALGRQHYVTSLATQVKRHLEVDLAKGADTWRLRYAELDGTPLDRWPAEALAYASDDPCYSLAVALCQSEADPVAPDLGPGLPPGWQREVKAAWALHLCAVWGMGTDPEAVAHLLQYWDTLAEAGDVAGVAGGWVRGDSVDLPKDVRARHLQAIYRVADAPDGAFTGRGKLSTSVDVVRRALASDPIALADATPAEAMAYNEARAALAPLANKGKEGTLDTAALQAIVSRAYGGEPPMTDPSATHPEGQVRTADEILEAAAKSPALPPDTASLLATFAGARQAGRYRKVWGPALLAGSTGPLTSKPNHLVASGRCSWADPPLQQPPRKGGVRECFVPTPGYVFASADFGTAELVALAQIHLWLGLDDSMAQAIRAGQDLHVRFAAGLLDLEYAEAWARYEADDHELSETRQLAKAANFGYPGGLGAASFQAYALATYGLAIDAGTAHRLREQWRATWPAMVGYFAWINAQLAAGGGVFQAVQFVSERRRGGCGYCDGANTFFQGLIGDVSKDAMWRVQEECWADPTSPLYGSRPLLLLHDEIVMETPLDRAPEAAERLSVLMVQASNDHMPDVPMLAKPALHDRWCKGAKPTRDPATGRLQVTPVRVPALG